ncbi:MAG: polysaccharide deacetylase family protein [Myxococcales bacterium]|nr:polysaccharide deacetylase family protein [Myxococcales bacterium]
MIEIAILLGCIAALCWFSLATWSRLGGKSRHRRLVVLRVGAAASVSAFAVLGFAWQLSRSREFQLLGQSVARVEGARKTVALTIDDGPTAAHTEQVLAILRQYGVRATFFVIGSELERNLDGGRAIVRDGHELGNHTYSHRRMLGSSLTFIKDELETTDRLIRAVGYQGPIYFRPAYGKRFILLPYYLRMTHRTSVLWDIEPESYPDIAGSRERIVQHVLDHVRPGSIILLHVMYDSRAASRAALPDIIKGLQSRGYELVTISSLLAR